jgi:hypothetical protein
MCMGVCTTEGVRVHCCKSVHVSQNYPLSVKIDILKGLGGKIARANMTQWTDTLLANQVTDMSLMCGKWYGKILKNVNSTIQFKM